MKYDASYFAQRGRVFNELKGFSFALALALFLRPKNLLDVGCGEGTLVKWSRRFGIKAFGVDISKNAFEKADVSFKKFLKVANIFKIPFKSRQFEIVTSFALMEHINNDETTKALKQLNRVSNKVLFFQICVKDNPLEGKHYLLDPTHINVQGSSWWVKKFKRAGMESTFSIPRLGIFLLKRG